MFEMWTPQYYPSMGTAHRYSTEQFITFYNRKMAYIYSHPDRFRRGTNTVPPATRANSAETGPYSAMRPSEHKSEF